MSAPCPFCGAGFGYHGRDDSGHLCGRPPGDLDCGCPWCSRVLAGKAQARRQARLQGALIAREAAGAFFVPAVPHGGEWASIPCDDLPPDRWLAERPPAPQVPAWRRPPRPRLLPPQRHLQAAGMLACGWLCAAVFVVLGLPWPAAAALAAVTAALTQRRAPRI